MHKTSKYGSENECYEDEFHNDNDSEHRDSLLEESRNDYYDSNKDINLKVKAILRNMMILVKLLCLIRKRKVCRT